MAKCSLAAGQKCVTTISATIGIDGEGQYNRVVNLRKELLEAYGAGDFLEAVFRCSLASGDRRDEVASELVALHNEGLIDIVIAFEGLKNDPAAKPDFFLTRNVFENALPQISASISSVMRCVVHLLREAGQDLVAGTIINSYIRFCERSRSRPSEAVKQIESDPDTFAVLLPSTIGAGSSFDPDDCINEAIRLCDCTNLGLKQQALVSLGSCRWPEGTHIPEKVFLALERAIATNDDDQVLSAVITAAFSLFQRDRSDETRVVSIIAGALAKGQQFAIHAAAVVFGFHSNELTPALFETLVPSLRSVPPENIGTVRNIDFGIGHLLKTENATRAISLLEQLLLANPGKLKVENFPTSVESIRSDSVLVSKIITRWLFNGSRVLCKAVQAMVEAPNNKTSSLRADPAELPSGEPLGVLFVGRKAVGYLFFKPLTAASFVISLMHHTNDNRVLTDLASLLFDPLLLNFTGALREYAVKTSQTESPDVKERIEKAIQSLDQYLANLVSVGEIPALHPGEAQREVYHRHFSQQVSKSFKAAQAKSTFLNLVSRSVVLHGTSSIHYVYSQDGSPKRMDMEFRRLGTEMEVPRMTHIDPFGLEYMLRVLRAEQRAK